MRPVFGVPNDNGADDAGVLLSVGNIPNEEAVDAGAGAPNVSGAGAGVPNVSGAGAGATQKHKLVR